MKALHALSPGPRTSSPFHVAAAAHGRRTSTDLSTHQLPHGCIGGGSVERLPVPRNLTECSCRCRRSGSSHAKTHNGWAWQGHPRVPHAAAAAAPAGSDGAISAGGGGGGHGGVALSVGGGDCDVGDVGLAAGDAGGAARHDYQLAGMYGMTDDALLDLLWQSAGLEALKFAAALPHMAASTRYLQVTPGNLAAWVSLLADLEVRSPAAVLASCPAFLLVPLTDEEPEAAVGDVYDGMYGNMYGDAFHRFVSHLRDTLLMDEWQVFGLLARLPSLALVPPSRLDDVITYLSVVIKGAGRGHRLGADAAAVAPAEGVPPGVHYRPDGGLIAFGVPAPAPLHLAATAPGLAAAAAATPSAPPLAEERELDLALYRFLRRAPAVLAMTRAELSYTLERILNDGSLGYVEMCRLVCAVPELLPAAAERAAMASGRSGVRQASPGAVISLAPNPDPNSNADPILDPKPSAPPGAAILREVEIARRVAATEMETAKTAAAAAAAAAAAMP